MVWSDSVFLQRGPELVEPWDPTLVGPASLDLRVGETGSYYGHDGQLQQVPLGNLSHPPGPVLLVPTLEWVRIPRDCAGTVRLRSSAARLGWRLAGAEWLDPGFEGRITLCLSHGHPLRLTLVPGQRLAQLIMWPLVGTVSRPYQGRYQYSAAEVGHVPSL